MAATICKGQCQHHLTWLVCTGLAGYVEYPTQQLTSGLLPLGDLPSLGSSPKTTCIKPGQGLPGFNSTAILDGMVSSSYGCGSSSETED
jgi:hypothetical protein